MIGKPIFVPIDETIMDNNVWHVLCSNVNAAPIIDQYFKKQCQLRLDLRLGHICENPSTVYLLTKRDAKLFDWWALSANPNALHILRRNQHAINWVKLAQNPNPKIIPLLHIYFQQSFNTMNRLMEYYEVAQHLCRNENDQVVAYLEEHPYLIDWAYLSQNKNARAIAYLEQNKHKINWNGIMVNSAAIHMIEPYIAEHVNEMNKNQWKNLCLYNTHAVALIHKYARNNYHTYMRLLTQNPNPPVYDWHSTEHSTEFHFTPLDDTRIILYPTATVTYWMNIACNPNAVSSLEKCPVITQSPIVYPQTQSIMRGIAQNPNAIHLFDLQFTKTMRCDLASNPNALHLLFTLNYSAMKQQMQPFAEELAACVFHPARLQRIADRMNTNSCTSTDTCTGLMEILAMYDAVEIDV